MFSSLIKNTAISAVAFFAVSVLGLLIVPYLIESYGVAGFGIISLARLFVPLMGLGFFDLGFGEISTQATARSRATSQWSVGIDLIAISLIFCLILGAILGGVLCATASWIAGLFAVSSEFVGDFELALRFTGILVPLLFASLVFEGVIKGFENFKLQRSIEVLSALLYTLAAIGCIWYGLSLFWVCLAFLGAQFCRALMAFFFASKLLIPFISHRRISPWNAWEEFCQRSPGLAFNKMLGTTQGNGPTFLIGAVLGPTSAGIFEALSRIPRFSKSVVGLLNATVQPLAVRIDNETKSKDLAKLVGTGTVLLACVVVPLYASAMVFSKPLLEFWLGKEMMSYWYWQAGLFVSPIFTAIVGFGASALIGRIQIVRQFNQIALFFVVIQLGLGLLLTSYLQEFGFVISQIIAASISFLFQVRLIAKSLRLGSAYYRNLGLICASTFGIAILALPLVVNINVSWLVPMAMAVLVTLMIGVCFGVGLNSDQRTVTLQTLKGRLNK